MKSQNTLSCNQNYPFATQKRKLKRTQVRKSSKVRQCQQLHWAPLQKKFQTIPLRHYCIRPKCQPLTCQVAIICSGWQQKKNIQSISYLKPFGNPQCTSIILSTVWNKRRNIIYEFPQQVFVATWTNNTPPVWCSAPLFSHTATSPRDT